MNQQQIVCKLSSWHSCLPLKFSSVFTNGTGLKRFWMDHPVSLPRWGRKTFKHFFFFFFIQVRTRQSVRCKCRVLNICTVNWTNLWGKVGKHEKCIIGTSEPICAYSLGGIRRVKLERKYVWIVKDRMRNKFNGCNLWKYFPTNYIYTDNGNTIVIMERRVVQYDYVI